jgi:hypothetical protein
VAILLREKTGSYARLGGRFRDYWGGLKLLKFLLVSCHQSCFNFTTKSTRLEAETEAVNGAFCCG